jgi:hypothetical protein
MYFDPHREDRGVGYSRDKTRQNDNHDSTRSPRKVNINIFKIQNPFRSTLEASTLYPISVHFYSISPTLIDRFSACTLLCHDQSRRKVHPSTHNLHEMSASVSADAALLAEHFTYRPIVSTPHALGNVNTSLNSNLDSDRRSNKQHQ